MKSHAGVVWIATLVLSVWTGPAVAQNYWLDLGINAGGSLHTSFFGEDDGFAGGDASFGTGWLVGAQLAVWPAARFGLRANLKYSDRSLDADNEITSHINLWSGSGDLLVRLATPNPTWQGPEPLPFLAVGLGRKWVNPAGDRYVCYDQPHNEVWSCEPLEKGAAAANSFALGEWKESLMVLLGIGADFRLSPHLLARAELNDRIYKPQVQASSAYLGGDLYNATDGDENLAGSAHEISLQAGLSLALGMRDAPVVAAPPPPPPPAQQVPPPPPAPPPPPRIDDISVCVIDPAATGGMRLQSAQFRHASSDTVVTRGGATIPMRQSVAGVTTAANADWFVRGTPFVMTMGQYREEFVTYGQPMTPGCDSLVYAGMVNGYPVFANPGSIAAFQRALQTAVTGANGDLTAALAADDELRQQFESVRTIYIPLDAVGPLMQPLQRQEQVRKGQQQ